MTYKNILVRVDSSFEIGTGHVMRDLVLAKSYPPTSNITFAVQNLTGHINQKIIDAGYKIHILKSHDINELIKYIQKCDIELLIIDHYGIDFNYEKSIQEHTDVTIFSLDDTYERHSCDILLNHNIYAEAYQYKNLVPQNCELQCGVNYTLLRDEFLHAYTYKEYIPKKRINIFIAMGGADSKNMNLTILEHIKNMPIEITLVTTYANSNLKQLEKYVKSYENMHLYIDSTSISDIIRKCDVAIVTPSVMVNEIIFLRIPFISVMVTDNQIHMHTFLNNRKFPCIDKSKIEQLPNLIDFLYTKDAYTSQLKNIDTIISTRINK